jgi:thiosulfate/3-mercaptopyruvate sulfurtransferase
MENMNKLQQITNISTEELLENLENPDFKILDVRPIDAYNGWMLNNETRGGHIKNARCLPLKWLNYIDWIEIVRDKGILPNHTLVIYGYRKSEGKRVANQFLRVGYSDIKIYNEFENEWSADNKYPMEKLDRYRHLVSAEWLNELISTGTAPEYNNTKYVICHVYYQNKDAYNEGHIPEAVDLDTNLFESPETWNRRSPEEIKSTLQQLGISNDTTIALYGRFSNPDNNDPFPGSSAGQLGAFRCAFIMLYAGVKDVRILNGGLQSWIDAGFKTTTKEFDKKPVRDFGTTIPVHPEIVVDLNEAKEILKDSNKNLVSVRSWKEFIGEESGYNYIEKKGRIPGAVFGNCGSDAYHMENYRNLDHTTREFEEIKKMWAKVGITPDKHNSFYCGTGWRGSEAFFNAWLMGWENISVFDGGWLEWSKKGNTYETGVPKDGEKN